MNVVQLHEWIARDMRAATKRRPDPKPRKAVKLSAKQLADAAALEQFWNAVETQRKGAGRPHSKKHLAGRWGVHPSNVSQYINGHIPLNVEAQLRFADYLDVAPTIIWPDFEFRHLCPGKLPPDAVEVALAYVHLVEDVKATARHLIASLPKNS